MRTLWICAVTGGPFQYTGKDMAQAHLQLHVTSAEFDEVGRPAAFQHLDAFQPALDRSKLLRKFPLFLHAA